MTSPDRQLAERAALESARTNIRDAIDFLETIQPSPPEPGAVTMTEERVRVLASEAVSMQAAQDHEILQDFEKRLDRHADSIAKLVRDSHGHPQPTDALERPPAAAKEAEGDMIQARESAWERVPIGWTTRQNFDAGFDAGWKAKFRAEFARAIRLQTIRECDAELVSVGWTAGGLLRMMEGT